MDEVTHTILPNGGGLSGTALGAGFGGLIGSWLGNGFGGFGGGWNRGSAAVRFCRRLNRRDVLTGNFSVKSRHRTSEISLQTVRQRIRH